jgi:phenylpyruvate tautomerase PptA (4-oxalocrotonate tautomerase family)
MPLIYVSCPDATFSAAAKDALAEELTSLALAAERLAATPFVRSTVWIYFHEYPAATVYHGGKSAGTKVISLEVNAFQGGMMPPLNKCSSSNLRRPFDDKRVSRRAISCPCISFSETCPRPIGAFSAPLSPCMTYTTRRPAPPLFSGCLVAQVI